VEHAAPIDHAGLDPLLRHDGQPSGKQLEVRATRGVEDNQDSGDPDRMAHINEQAGACLQIAERGRAVPGGSPGRDSAPVDGQGSALWIVTRTVAGRPERGRADRDQDPE